jgi:hypothetical protein
MRFALVVGLALLFLPTLPAANASPVDPDGEGTQVAMVPMRVVSLDLVVQQAQPIALQIDFTLGAMVGLAVDGPGSCDHAETLRVAMVNTTRDSLWLYCGKLEAGRYTIEISIDAGYGRGRVSSNGASLDHSPE